MRLKERFVDGVSSLFDKLGGSEELSAVDPEALERELALRVEARKAAGNPKPSENERARLAASGAAARKQREALAKGRVARIHAERARKAQSKKAEQDAAYRHMAEEARRNPPPRYSSSSSGYASSAGPGSSSSSGSRGSTRPSIFQNKELAKHYKTIGVAYGADAITVKKAYRQMMRKYHPDLHQDPKKKKAATELTMKIATAYAAIEKANKG